MPQKDTSACHNAPVSVRGGDEGTSYYVCGVCHKPCDIAPKSDMPDDGVREQIDEILWRQSCYPGSVGLSPSEVRDAIEALIAAAETKARIDGAKQFWLWLAPIQAAIFAGNITREELDRRVREYSASLRHPEREGA